MSYDIDEENCGTCKHSKPYTKREDNPDILDWKGSCTNPKAHLQHHNSFPRGLELAFTRCGKWEPK